jgi:hypothetical protein
LAGEDLGSISRRNVTRPFRLGATYTIHSLPPFEDRVKSKPSHNGEDFNLDSSKGVANLPIMHWKRRKFYVFLFNQVAIESVDVVAEWLRRQTANLLCSARMSSNLIHVDAIKL